MRELTRVELERSDLVIALSGARCPEHAEQLDSQVVGVDCPLQLRLRRNAVGRGYSDSTITDRFDCAALGAAVGQVNDQTVASLDLRIAVERDDSARCSGDPAAVRAPCDQFVSHRNHVTWQWDAPLHPSPEGHSTVLAIAE
ncbi:hypothetical protein D3C77_542150 [compost metagenome]